MGRTPRCDGADIAEIYTSPGQPPAPRTASRQYDDETHGHRHAERLGTLELSSESRNDGFNAAATTPDVYIKYAMRGRDQVTDDNDTPDRIADQRGHRVTSDAKDSGHRGTRCPTPGGHYFAGCLICAERSGQDHRFCPRSEHNAWARSSGTLNWAAVEGAQLAPSSVRVRPARDPGLGQLVIRRLAGWS